MLADRAELKTLMGASVGGVKKVKLAASLRSDAYKKGLLKEGYPSLPHLLKHP